MSPARAGSTLYFSLHIRKAQAEIKRHEKLSAHDARLIEIDPA